MKLGDLWPVGPVGDAVFAATVAARVAVVQSAIDGLNADHVAAARRTVGYMLNLRGKVPFPEVPLPVVGNGDGSSAWPGWALARIHGTLYYLSVSPDGVPFVVSWGAGRDQPGPFTTLVDADDHFTIPGPVSVWSAVERLAGQAVET